MIDKDEATAARPPMPALPPHSEDRHGAVDLVKGSAPGWAEWLDEGQTPRRDANGELRPYDSDAEDMFRAEDPMAPLVTEVRRRAAETRRRKQLRDRVLLGAAVCAILAVIAGGLWLRAGPEETTTAQPAPPASESIAPVADQPGNEVWCRDATTAEQVSGSGMGDLTSGPGVIMRLEYAWYVLRDASVARSLLTPDAVAAPEQATHDAIAAVQAGTKHCVTITRTTTADRWDVTIDERHPDGSQSSWRQIFTTTTRDSQVRISSIIASGQ